jgi:tetratricopeptide (TPR) repeat protein
MAKMLTKSFYIALVALLLLVTFTAGEVLIDPDDYQAQAQRRRRKTGDEQKPAETTQQQGGDELGQALGQQTEDGMVPIPELVVENDIPLTSNVGIKIDESIAKLLKILERFQEPSTFRRLAEFYWKKANRLNLDMMQEHGQKMDVWMEAGQQGDPPREPDPDFWYKYNRMAIKICNIIITKYPEFQGLDEVYFFMGYNLVAIEQDTDAVQYYKKLVREFPNSAFVPDSWMAIGDYYFGHNNVYDALPAYEEVLKFENSKVFGYAKYKIGWCYYNLGKYKDAIETFKEVVSWSQEQSAAGGSQINLLEEALKDLVMAFAEDGSVDDAEAYFKTVGGDKYFRSMLIKLAEIYTNQGKFKDSIMIYKRLIRDYPDHLDNSDFQLRIVEAYSNMNDKENTTKEIIEMVYYAKPEAESGWVKAHSKKDSEKVQEAWENAERMLIKTVVEYHKEALKIDNKDTWNMAQSLYEMYIAYFQKSEMYYDVCFNYAELLYRREMFKDAGLWYTKVAEMNPKGKHFEDASYSAILAYEKLVHGEIQDWIGDTKQRSMRKEKSYKLATTEAEQAKEAEQQETYTQRPLSENVQGFVKACNLYIDNIPDSKYKVDIIYKVAIIYYAHNNFADAVRRFEMIVNDYPTHRLAEYAANLVLDSLNINQSWRKLNETVRAYLKNKRLVQRAAFRQDLKILLEKSSFKKVDVTVAEGNMVAAAEEYLAFAKEFPKSEARDKAIYNAAVYYVNAGDLVKAIDVQQKFLKEHPKSQFAGDVTFKLGKNYEALAYYPEAATQYEQYAEKYPQGEFYNDALFNASIFYENMGQTDKAIALKNRYIEKVKKEKPEEADAVYFMIGFTYLDNGDAKNAEKHFKDYLKSREKDITWPRIDKTTGDVLAKGNIKGDANKIYVAHVQLIDIYRKAKRDAEVKESLATVRLLAQCETKVALNEAARDVIAEAAFFKVQENYDKYVTLKLEVGRRLSKEKWNEAIAQRMKEKYDILAQLQGQYEQVIALGSPNWSVASLYMIGQSLKFYSLAMFNSEMPYWLTEDQRVIYVDALYQRAEPIEQKALQYFLKCTETAYKTGVYSEYTTKALGELEGYSAIQPVKAFGFNPGYESDSVFSAQFEDTEIAKPKPAPVETAPAAPEAGDDEADDDPIDDEADAA